MVLLWLCQGLEQTGCSLIHSLAHSLTHSSAPACTRPPPICTRKCAHVPRHVRTHVVARPATAVATCASLCAPVPMCCVRVGVRASHQGCLSWQIPLAPWGYQRMRGRVGGRLFMRLHACTCNRKHGCTCARLHVHTWHTRSACARALEHTHTHTHTHTHSNRAGSGNAVVITDVSATMEEHWFNLRRVPTAQHNDV